MRSSDWSSDVCSSDLFSAWRRRSMPTPASPIKVKLPVPVTLIYDAEGKEVLHVNGPLEWDGPKGKALVEAAVKGTRSEERRVGKEGVSTCRYGWSRYHTKKTKQDVIERELNDN